MQRQSVLQQVNGHTMFQNHPKRLAVSFVALAVAGAVLAGATTPGADSQVGPTSQTPRFRVATNFVQVDVYPTSGDRPVTDLAAGDFEVLEDGTPQKIERFEHVTVRAAGPQDLRVEPSNVEASNQMAADLATRVFVVFLDTYHVEFDGAHRIQQPLINLLNRVIGQDDLVAVMTPEMSARDLTFTRRTQSIEAVLSRAWDWAKRDRVTERTPQEQMYEACYMPDPRTAWQDTLAGKMIERRREKVTLDALRDLVMHLEGLREGRKAILAVSDGWRLFREDRSLADAAPPQPAGVFIGPGGKLGVGSDPRAAGGSQYECSRDRMLLAMLDNDREFRDLLDEANRANATFYPVDPRGLAVFDTPLGPAPPIDVVRDASQLRGRLDTLRTLAAATDGIAVVNTNDLDRGLARIVSDLTSYYLLGYYSTNSKPDGRFRKITVRVKRPGVQVRARRGYLAPSEADLAAKNAAGSPAVAGGPGAPAPADAAATTLAAAMDVLARIRPDMPVSYRAGYAWQKTDAPEAGPPAAGIGAALWVTGELDPRRTADEGWREGGEVTVTATNAARQMVGSASAVFSRTERAFRVLLPRDRILAAGVYELRISARSAAGVALPPEALRVTVPSIVFDSDRLALGQPLLFRRGPFTGPTFQPAADPRFRRQEWIRLEASVVGVAEERTGRILDRTGRPLDVPVKVTERLDGSTTWIQGEVALASLGPGDYLIELGVGGRNASERVLAAFRIVP